jgi:hypothetical protein
MRSPEEIQSILKRIQAIHVKTERDIQFKKILDRLLAKDAGGNLLPDAMRVGQIRETRGIMVIDGPGGGKSTLVRHSLFNHQVLAESSFEKKHVLDISVPNPATMKSVSLELLKATGYENTNTRREVWGLWEVLRHRLGLLGVAVLWIDEAHDLFMADHGRVLRALKSLMQGDDAVILILSGTELLLEAVNADPQVKRRLSTIRLPPVSFAADGQSFNLMIRQFCEISGLEPPRDQDLVERLLHASRYRFGRCIETVRNAIECALDREAAVLDILDFAEVWACAEGCDPSRNVFLAEDWAEIDPDMTDEGSASLGQKSKTRRRLG